MTKALYEKKEGPKQLYLAKIGGHAQSYNENPEEYEAQIETFLNTFLLHGYLKTLLLYKRAQWHPFSDVRTGAHTMWVTQ